MSVVVTLRGPVSVDVCIVSLRSTWSVCVLLSLSLSLSLDLSLSPFPFLFPVVVPLCMSRIEHVHPCIFAHIHICGYTSRR